MNRRRTARDSGNQFLGVKWFDDIIIGAQFQTENFVKSFAFGRKHDDRNVWNCDGFLGRPDSRRYPEASDPEESDQDEKYQILSVPVRRH